VECKASSPSRPIGVQEVRELYGAKLEEGASNALLVTAGTFTQGAKDFAQSKRDLLLVDGDEVLTSWVRGSKPPIPRAKETLLRFVLKSTGNPLELMSRFHPHGMPVLNRTAWRGKAPRTCGVLSVNSRPSPQRAVKLPSSTCRSPTDPKASSLSLAERSTMVGRQ
jgi:hypothetical protein